METNILMFGSHLGFKWIIRHNGLGFRCGYVLIPPGHSWHAVDFQEIEASCHGGLTYSNWHDNGSDWIVGFDCAHFNDGWDPDLPSECDMPYFSGPIRDNEYVRAECISLIEQAKKAGSKWRWSNLKHRFHNRYSRLHDLLGMLKLRM